MYTCRRVYTPGADVPTNHRGDGAGRQGLSLSWSVVVYSIVSSHHPQPLLARKQQPHEVISMPPKLSIMACDLIF